MVFQRRTRRASICTSHRRGGTWRYSQGYSQGTHTGVISEYSQGYSEGAHRGTLRDAHRIRTGDSEGTHARYDKSRAVMGCSSHRGGGDTKENAHNGIVQVGGSVTRRGTHSGYSFGVLIRGTHRGSYATDKDTRTGTRRGSSMHRARDVRCCCKCARGTQRYSSGPPKGVQRYSRVLKRSPKRGATLLKGTQAVPPKG